MSDANLKNLFRQFAAPRGAMPVPNVEALLALAQLPHAEDTTSPLQADLLRFSGELEPASAKLSSDLAAAFSAIGVVAPHRRMAPRRAASAPRRWGVAIASASAMAASLIVAVALFATHRGHAPAPASAAVAADRIFSGFDERNMAAGKASHGDEIFRANFHPDEIFSSSKPNEG